MNRRRITNALPSLALAMVAVAYVWMSYDYDFASRTLPWIAGVLAFTLAVTDVAAERDSGSGGASGEPVSLRREAIAFGWIGVFLPLVVVAGFYAATLLYVFCYLRLYANKGALASATTAFAVLGFLYMVFQVLMGYEIFGGLLAGDHL